MQSLKTTSGFAPTVDAGSPAAHGPLGIQPATTWDNTAETGRAPEKFADKAADKPSNKPVDAASQPDRACSVSVVIKVLNEEQRIAQTLECALRAVQAVGGEVVLADSCSTDRTLEIASAYPIRIVQLAHADERSCGIGAQLGFQHARGEFIYILDGDMQMNEQFLPQALSFLRAHPQIAGVGGRIIEKNLDSLEFLTRSEHKEKEPVGPASGLDGGGLYRRSAIASADYFANRNLHSYEEFDLAMRLRCLGWELWRMPVDAASHFGHESPPYKLLMRRWKSGYICGLGELLRGAYGKPHLLLVLREVRELRIYAAMLGLLALVLLLLLWPAAALPRLAGAAALLALPVAVMSWRKGSFERGLYAVVSWGVNVLGMLRGLLRTPMPPTRPVEGQVLQEGEVFPAPPKPQMQHGTPALGLNSKVVAAAGAPSDTPPAQTQEAAAASPAAWQGLQAARASQESPCS